MLGDGRSDFSRLVFEHGVVTPHYALQVRELTDHAGDQIAFAQLRCAHGRSLIALDARGDDAGQRCKAAHLVADRAQLGLKRDFVQCRYAAGQRLGLVLRIEERGISKPRPHHALVARPHGLRIGAVDVADGDEPRQQCALAVFDGEIALMGLQRRHQHFTRQR